MSKSDYYETLGVAKNATEADLKKAYRRLAMRYHPDRNTEDAQAEEKFKEVREAYSILSDAQKRAAYDQFGHDGVRSGVGQTGEASGFSDIFDSVFGDIFGGAHGGQEQAHRGADLQYNLEVSLEDAVFGSTAKIKVPKHVACNVCNGSGAKKGSQPSSCTRCQGHGQIRMQQGFFSVQQTCPQCRGNGVVIKDPCRSCRGSGRVRDSKIISVKVPAGIDHGDRIRLAGEGEVGMHGASAGYLYVQISIKPHALFTRDGMDLHCEIPIGFAMAALGGELELPSLAGKLKLKIPAGTQTGKVFRMRGQGAPSVRSSGRGDLLCSVIVEVPVALNKKQKELIRELDESMNIGDKHSPKTNSWLDKVKQFFDVTSE